MMDRTNVRVVASEIEADCVSTRATLPSLFVWIEVIEFCGIVHHRVMHVVGRMSNQVLSYRFLRIVRLGMWAASVVDEL